MTALQVQIEVERPVPVRVPIPIAPGAAFTNCRPDCGACCIAPSISSPIPGMPEGKPAGVRCVQLDALDRCRIFDQPERPLVCASLRPEPQMCGANRQQAMIFLQNLERATRPVPECPTTPHRPSA